MEGGEVGRKWGQREAAVRLAECDKDPERSAKFCENAKRQRTHLYGIAICSINTLDLKNTNRQASSNPETPYILRF